MTGWQWEIIRECGRVGFRLLVINVFKIQWVIVSTAARDFVLLHENKLKKPLK